MKKLIYSQEDLDLILTLELEEKDKEIERLNNIINELEKWSEEYRFADIFKNKLQELKGSDKE